jgi:predicted KAP-like P-loop ATPase
MTIKANKELPFLTKETNLLKLKEKSKILKLFIEDIINDENNIQMIALYGDWGSGKTTLMKDLIKDIDKERFKPIFFEAWRYEKDNNIAKSLFSIMLENLEESGFKKLPSQLVILDFSDISSE